LAPEPAAATAQARARTAKATPASRHVAELRATDLSGSVGQVLGADLFESGERVDVTGISKGKASPRHAGYVSGPGRATGTTRSTVRLADRRAPRRPACSRHEDGRPARQHPHHHAQLEVVEGDAERVATIKGAVPGPNGGLSSFATQKAPASKSERA
jgi:large subunit ribosomal protein L3